jgi:hypothetical protein
MKKTVPAQLESAYIKRTHRAVTAPALAEVEAMTSDDYAVMPVVGDCMEGAGIPDGGFVAVSFRHFPRPPRRGVDGHLHEYDACLCWIKGENGPFAGIKEYAGVWGPMQMVSTHYGRKPGDPFRMNWMPPAEHIFGVVFACWDSAGRLLWQHDLEKFPRELGTDPTIRGVNVGNPQRVEANSSQGVGAV